MDFLTTKNIQRLSFLLLAISAILIQMYMLLGSQILYYLSFEHLNSNAKYLKMPSYKIYNWLFISFVVFVVLVRADLFGFSDTIAFHINTAEHLYFSGVMCLMLLIYMQLFNLASNNLLMRLTVVFVILNLLGLINEFFQNLFQERPFFSIEGNDIKDMIVNLVGSSLFVIISLLYKSKTILTEEI